MTGKYKEAPDRYAYQIALEETGYRLGDVFYGGGGPQGSTIGPYDFDKNYPPEDETAWAYRRAIKEFIKGHPEIYGKYDYKIVKAVGYWRDLYPFVYEIWVKPK